MNMNSVFILLFMYIHDMTYAVCHFHKIDPVPILLYLLFNAPVYHDDPKMNLCLLSFSKSQYLMFILSSIFIQLYIFDSYILYLWFQCLQWILQTARQQSEHRFSYFNLIFESVIFSSIVFKWHTVGPLFFLYINDNSQLWDFQLYYMLVFSFGKSWEWCGWCGSHDTSFWKIYFRTMTEFT